MRASRFSYERVGRLREIEVEPSDAAGVVRGPEHAGLAPADEDVGMMIALLGEHAEANGEGERCAEVGELERTNEPFALSFPTRMRGEPGVDVRAVQLGGSCHVPHCPPVEGTGEGLACPWRGWLLGIVLAWRSSPALFAGKCSNRARQRPARSAGWSSRSSRTCPPRSKPTKAACPPRRRTRSSRGPTSAAAASP